MTRQIITTKSAHQLTEIGWLGFNVHNHERPHDESSGMQARSASLIMRRVKRSVEEGYFLPGQYRVNPYFVSSGRFGMLNLKRGAAYKADLIPGHLAGTYPGIRSIHLDQLREEDPIYFITSPFVNTYWAKYAGYIPGKTYRDVAWVVGDWWRYELPKAGSDKIAPLKADSFCQLALQKAAGKVKSADLDLGETVGEYRQTVEMLRSPLSALKKFLFDDKSRNFRLLRAIVRQDKKEVTLLSGRTTTASVDAISGAWLELRYGLRPLVMLVQDVIKSVNKGKTELLDPDKIRNVRSRLKFGPYENRTIQVHKDYSYYSGCNIRSFVEVKDEYWANASVSYKQTDTQSLMDTLGLTPRFLPETVWALTTCSFVWDWLFSIGPWLATLRVNPNIELLGNTVGFKHVREVRVRDTQLCVMNYKAGMPWTSLGADVNGDGETPIFTTETYERFVDEQLSYLPHFTWGRTLDLWKLIDSISLLWQPFSKGLSRKH